MSVVKVTFEGEVRRGRVEEVTYEALLKVVTELVPDVHELVLRYVDEDGDTCLLTEQTFDDFVEQCTGGPLRVTAAGHRGRGGRLCPGKIWRHLRGEVTPELIAELMVTHGELAAAMVERKAWKLDRVAGWWPEKVRPVVAVVVEGLRDIPEISTCRAGLEHALDAELAGLGQAVIDLAREFVAQPVEVQRRIAEALSVHLVPLIDRLRGGRRVICDGCDERIWGGRMKCRECPDYDLCGGCYEKRGELHGDHEFDWAQCRGKGKGKGWWGRKGCKGKGKGRWSVAESFSCTAGDAACDAAEGAEVHGVDMVDGAVEDWEMVGHASQESCAGKGWGKWWKGKGGSTGWKGHGKGYGCRASPWSCEAAANSRYEAEVDQLAGMGFEHRELNHKLLVRHGGNVAEVIRMLLE